MWILIYLKVYKKNELDILLYIIWEIDQTKIETTLNKFSEDVQQRLFDRLLPIYLFTTRDTRSSARIFNQKNTISVYHV